MKKKLLSTLLALCMVLTLLPGTTLAAEAKEVPVSIRESASTSDIVQYGMVLPSDIKYPVTGGNIYFDKKSGIITGCERSVTAANIPSTIEGVPVTAIMFEAFMNCKDLTSVVIPNTVTDIEHLAFADCTSLTNVVIPDSVNSIYGSFSGCTSLTNVAIPNSVTSINGAFSGCTGLTSVVIPSSVKSMKGTFSGCTGLTSVIIPGSVKECNSAFSGCTRLTNAAILDGVGVIGSYAFKNCSALSSVLIPDSVWNICGGAFYGCTSLSSVVMPEWVTLVQEHAFDGCTSLTSVVMPKHITSIYHHTFSGCTGLTDIAIPTGVKTIANSAFSGCTSLTSVTIPVSVKSITSSAFYGCERLEKVYYSGTKAQWDAISIGEGNDSLKNATVIYKSTGPDTPTPPPTASCTITFIDQQTGKQISTRQVQSGKTVGSLPTAPAHSGYTFQGWYDASGKKVTASTKVTGDMTVYARYQKENSPGTSTGFTFNFGFNDMVFDPVTGTATIPVQVLMDGILVTTIDITITLNVH